MLATTVLQLKASKTGRAAEGEKHYVWTVLRVSDNCSEGTFVEQLH